MVWLKNVGMRPAFVCDSCGFGYRDVNIALECEKYCKRGSSSVKIQEKSIYCP